MPRHGLSHGQTVSQADPFRVCAVECALLAARWLTLAASGCTGRQVPRQAVLHLPRHDVQLREALAQQLPVWLGVARRTAAASFCPIRLQQTSCCVRALITLTASGNASLPTFQLYLAPGTWH